MGRSPATWDDKIEKGFWRGRDSRQERLDLVVMSRKHPAIVDAKMTRMFFFKHDQEKYGDLVDSIPFFDFFKVSRFLQMNMNIFKYMIFLINLTYVIFDNFLFTFLTYWHYIYEHLVLFFP